MESFKDKSPTTTTTTTTSLLWRNSIDGNRLLEVKARSSITFLSDGAPRNPFARLARYDPTAYQVGPKGTPWFILHRIFPYHPEETPGLLRVYGAPRHQKHSASDGLESRSPVLQTSQFQGDQVGMVYSSGSTLARVLAGTSYT